ncbi:hypothetical protein [Mucilaginibacter sp. BT774]|uniref:hypothetical protein n=1 Tax=Mucilaginibacter sp. BT774 TaxID=3062276 RepID=UPI0026745E96|nr:hypothetical protein [Mucilaginibacter sp. BT774]MDO3628867.1 hypothetical protein [Mucilaginibacter sp. BT774]
MEARNIIYRFSTLLLLIACSSKLYAQSPVGQQKQKAVVDSLVRNSLAHNFLEDPFKWARGWESTRSYAKALSTDTASVHKSQLDKLMASRAKSLGFGANNSLKTPGLPNTANLQLPSLPGIQTLPNPTGIITTGQNASALKVPSGTPSVPNVLSNPVPGQAMNPAAVKNQLTTGISKISPSISSLPINSSGLTSKISSSKGLLDSSASRLLNVRSALVGQAFSNMKPINDAISKNFKSLPNSTFSANFALENDVQYNPIQLIPNGSKFQEVIGMRGTLMVMGVPLNLNISNNQAAFNGQSPFAGASLFKFGFNPASYAGLLKNQLQQYSDLKNTAFQGFNFTDYVRQTITNQVQSLRGDVSGLKSSPFSNLVSDPEKLQGLITMSKSELHSKLRAIADEKNKALPDSSGKVTELSEAEKQANIRKADSLENVITAINKKITSKGLDPATLILEENYLSGKTSSGFNSSEAALNLFEKRPANALQSMFGGIRGLHVGSFGTTLPGATEDGQSRLVSGADLTVKMGYYPFTVGFGTLNDMNSMKDAGFDNSIYLFPKNITYIGAEMPRSVFGNVKVSVVSSSSSQFSNLQYGVPTLPGNSVAFTVTKSLNVENVGHLTFDASKSATLFSKDFSPGSETLLLRKAGANYDLSNDLFQSLSLGVRHHLDIPGMNASDNVYFNYAGLGYQNPANNGYSGASMKFGGDLKKSFYKNDLVFDLRGDYSSTPLSYTNSDKFKNYRLELDSRYKVNNRCNLDFKYSANGTSQVQQGTSNSVYNAQKFEVGLTDSYKIGSYVTTTRASIADQSFMNTYMSAAGSNLLNLTYVQTMAFKTSSLTGTLFYNKEMTSSQLLGNMLTSDMIYQYQLFKRFQLSSGVTYLSNASYVKQIGVKQGLQLIASKHYDITASMDLMKNLMTPQYADLYPSCRGELTLKYYLKID